MIWRGTSSGQSIFNREMKRLGRPLQAIEKLRVISQYTAIITALLLAPFLMTSIWESNQLHPIPITKTYQNMNIRLGGGGKSPPAIVITEHDRNIFVSPCDGLYETVCSQTELLEKSISVNLVEVIELSPGKGVIKHIELEGLQGKVLNVTNQMADSLVLGYPRNPYWKNRFLLTFTVCASLIFLILKIWPSIRNANRSKP